MVRYKELFSFIGLVNNFSFFKKKDFYLSILLAQFFLILLWKFYGINRFGLLYKENFYVFLFSQIYVSFFEELIFRGFIQGYLDFFLKKKSFSIIFTSLIFSFFHIFKHNLLWSLGVFFPGIIFGYFREKYSLWASITLHFVYNFEYFLFFS